MGLLNFSTTIPGWGTFSTAETDGKVTASFNISKSLGGGKTASWLVVNDTLSVVGQGAMVVDVAFLQAEAKWPGVASLLAIAKAEFDTFIAAN